MLRPCLVPLRLGCALLALLPAVVLAQTASETRGISGTLAYRERIALSPEAVIVVEARDAGDTLVAEFREAAAGRQVPLPFALDLPTGVSARLRAALLGGGPASWVSPEIEVAEGTGPVDLGQLPLTRHLPLGFASRLRCGEREILLGYLGDGAVIETDGRRIRLIQVVAASGSRFEAPDDPDTWVWTKGDTALARLGGVDLPECRLAVPAEELPWRATGSEPGWALELADGRAVLTRDYGARREEWPLPAARGEAGAWVLRLPSEPEIAVRIMPALCRDAATGMPHPDTVTLEQGEERLAGCGGAPIALLAGGEWIVEDIGGGGIIDSSHVTLAVDRSGRVAGRGGCNRYFGPLTITGEGIAFGLIGATMMACGEALMAQERRFFDALAAVARFDLDPTGALLLIGADGRVLVRARRG